MKFINLVQGSKEWIDYRRSRIGASDCAGILNESPFATPLKVFREKIFGETKKETMAMTHGKNMEERARLMYNKKGMIFEPAVIEHPNKYMFCSLDGINVDNSVILEIKVVGKKTWDEVNDGKVPRYIEWQVQHQLACVSKATHAILWVCHVIGDEMIGVDFVINRDPIMQKKLYECCESFYFDHMLSFVEPDAVDADIETRSDSDWMALASERVRIDGEMKKLEYLDKINREKMIALAAGRSCKGGGVTLTKYHKKGTIDYKSVPVLEGIDLDEYRKPGTEQWRLSI